jgi:hypothetical protein
VCGTIEFGMEVLEKNFSMFSCAFGKIIFKKSNSFFDFYEKEFEEKNINN